MTEKDIIDYLDRLKDAWPELISFETGNDDGQYVNLTIETANRTTTWNRVRSQLIESKLLGAELRDAMIVTMTGAAGWDDYLLLHHYDRTEPLDELEKTKE